MGKPEIEAFLTHLAIDREGGGGRYRLMVELTYGAGLRLLECCRLRVKDVDFGRRQLVVREGKGDKDRVVPVPSVHGHTWLRSIAKPELFVEDFL